MPPIYIRINSNRILFYRTVASPLLNLFTIFVREDGMNKAKIWNWRRKPFTFDICGFILQKSLAIDPTAHYVTFPSGLTTWKAWIDLIERHISTNLPNYLCAWLFRQKLQCLHQFHKFSHFIFRVASYSLCNELVFIHPYRFMSNSFIYIRHKRYFMWHNVQWFALFQVLVLSDLCQRRGEVNIKQNVIVDRWINNIQQLHPSRSGWRRHYPLRMATNTTQWLQSFSSVSNESNQETYFGYFFLSFSSLMESIVYLAPCSSSSYCYYRSPAMLSFN